MHDVCDSGVAIEAATVVDAVALAEDAAVLAAVAVAVDPTDPADLPAEARAVAEDASKAAASRTPFN